LESTVCPNCQKSIRIPVEVLGQRAQCPFCKCHFRAPVRTPEGLTEPELLRRNPFAQAPTFGPGIALLFVGLLGMVSNGIQVSRAYSDPAEFERQTREVFERNNLPEVERTIKWMPVARVGFLGLSGLVVLAGIAMLRQRWHGVAMIGSAAALFLVSDCCCLLGFPAGAWALFVLRNPTVRAMFHSPAA
jgi:hypothetical protein